MSKRIEIDGKKYSFDELAPELQEKYRDDFLKAEKAFEQMKIEKPKATTGQKLFGYFFLGVILGVIGLTFLSFFSDVNTLIEVKGAWLLIYASVLILVLGVIAFPYVKGNAQIPFGGGPVKKFGAALGAVFGLSVLTAFAVFSGIPTVLHHISSSEGKMVVTVSGKSDSYDKRKCSPRLIVEDFTWFSSNYLCPSEEAYEQISVGSKVELQGKVSIYGIEPSQMRWEAVVNK